MGIVPGTEPEFFPESWRCPICRADKSHLDAVSDMGQDHMKKISYRCINCGTLQEVQVPDPEILRRYTEGKEESEELEPSMPDIHAMSVTARSVIEPMRTKKPVPSWDDILIMGAQIARIPLNEDIPVSTRTVIGPTAKQPLVIELPFFITHMSFGALSRETKIALAKGSAAVKTAIGSGEGGILEEERKNAYRYIFEYVPNRYSVTENNLRQVDAIEIKLGQAAEPGLGARLPAEKVTPEIAQVRGHPEGNDIISPASFEDIRSGEDLKKKIHWLRRLSKGKPVGVKIAAGNIEDDLEVILAAQPDFITIDGRPGGTGAAPKFIKAATSLPTVFALYRARRYLEEQDIRDISLIITGGLRVSSDFAKAFALGADAIAIGTAALIACGCQQYRICHTGTCPMGVTTQKPELRKRMDIDISAKRLENFLRVSNEELKSFARLAGYTNIHQLSIRDLRTISSEISNHTTIRHV
jgi:glutamate synthase domain-containing protein 2